MLADPQGSGEPQLKSTVPVQYSFASINIRKCYSSLSSQIKVKVPPAPMAHRAAPISASSSSRPHVCECSESNSGGAGPLVAPRV